MPTVLAIMPRCMEKSQVKGIESSIAVDGNNRLHVVMHGKIPSKGN